MNLDDLKKLDDRALVHIRNAEHATGLAKTAANWRNNPDLMDADVDLKIRTVAHWDGGPVREKIQAAVREHLPAILRTIELEEQAKAKRENLAADLIKAQITAAIVEA